MKTMPTLLMIAALATTQLSAQTLEGRIDWSCARQGALTYPEISSLGRVTYVQAKQVQLNLYQQIRRACHAPGVLAVTIVSRPSATDTPLVAAR